MRWRTRVKEAPSVGVQANEASAGAAHRFLRDEQGAVAAIFAIVFAAVLMTAAITIDFALGTSEQTREQQALDAATLAASDLLGLPNQDTDGPVMAGADIRHVPITPDGDFFGELEQAIHAEQYRTQLQEAGANPEELAEQLEKKTRSASLANEITRLTEEIAALGAVNLAALSELNAAKERKDFLDAQALDLTQAIETLEAAIKRIDRETDVHLSLARIPLKVKGFHVQYGK